MYLCPTQGDPLYFAFGDAALREPIHKIRTASLPHIRYKIIDELMTHEQRAEFPLVHEENVASAPVVKVFEGKKLHTAADMYGRNAGEFYLFAFVFLHLHIHSYV